MTPMILVTEQFQVLPVKGKIQLQPTTGGIGKIF